MDLINGRMKQSILNSDMLMYISSFKLIWCRAIWAQDVADKKVQPDKGVHTILILRFARRIGRRVVVCAEGSVIRCSIRSFFYEPTSPHLLES